MKQFFRLKLLFVLILQTRAKTKDSFFSVNHCEGDMVHVRGSLFCGYIGKEHKPDSFTLDVKGLSKINMGFLSDAQNDFPGFLLRWILV